MQKISTRLRKGERVETGSVKFDDDWPGLFLRGTDAFSLAQHIKRAIAVINKKRELSAFERVIVLSELEGVVKEIEDAVVVKRAEGL